MRALTLLAAVLATCAAHADEVLTTGALPVYSPDGTRLAFQRETSEGMRLGVLDLAKHTVQWIDGAPGNAAQPAWHPTNGSLVYVYGHETRTAKEGFFAKDRTGWNLRLWKDGKVTSLTRGRVMDYTPTFSPDGRFVYFASTRVPVAPGRTSGTVLYRVPAAGGAPERLTDYAGNSSGLASPAFSPDGKCLLRAELESAFGAWRLVASSAASPRRTCRVSAADLVAYAPRWSPDGRLVCLTGYRTGDAGWSVYLLDPRTGSDTRLFPGREPAFSPDGRRLAYVLDGVIREHVLANGEKPAVVSAPTARAIPDGKALVLAERPSRETAIPLAANCAFGDEQTFYIRFKGVAPSSNSVVGAQCAFAGRYAESPLGFQIVFHNGGLCTFALRLASGEYFAVQAPERITWGAPVEVVGIRHGGSAYISVNGSSPRRLEYPSTLALKTPREIAVCPPYHGLRPDCRADVIEVGCGWPKGVERPCTLQEVFP